MACNPCIVAELNMWFQVEEVANVGSINFAYYGPALGHVELFGSGGIATGGVFKFRDTSCNGRYTSCTAPSPPLFSVCGPSSAAASQTAYRGDSAANAELHFAPQLWAPYGYTTTVAQVDRDLIAVQDMVSPGNIEQYDCSTFNGTGFPPLTSPVSQRVPPTTGTFVSPFVDYRTSLAGATFGGLFRWKRYGAMRFFVIFDTLQSGSITRAGLLAAMAAGTVKVYADFVPDIVSVSGAAMNVGDIGNLMAGSTGHFSLLGPQSVQCVPQAVLSPTKFVSVDNTLNTRTVERLNMSGCFGAGGGNPVDADPACTPCGSTTTTVSGAGPVVVLAIL